MSRLLTEVDPILQIHRANTTKTNTSRYLCKGKRVIDSDKALAFRPLLWRDFLTSDNYITHSHEVLQVHNVRVLAGLSVHVVAHATIVPWLPTLVAGQVWQQVALHRWTHLLRVPLHSVLVIHSTVTLNGWSKHWVRVVPQPVVAVQIRLGPLGIHGALSGPPRVFQACDDGTLGYAVSAPTQEHFGETNVLWQTKNTAKLSIGARNRHTTDSGSRCPYHSMVTGGLAGECFDINVAYQITQCYYQLRH